MAKHRARINAGLRLEAFQSPRHEPQGRAEAGLHVCPACASELVYPVEWAPAQRGRWSVALRCPECGSSHEGVFEQDLVDRFDEVLDIGTEQLLEDLRLLTRANMEEQVDRFAAALDDDRILPEDF